MDETLGEKLSRLRRASGMSQRELAARLSDAGIAVTNQAISKWEKGLTQPSAQQFLALCAVLGVGSISEEFAGRDGSVFRELNEAGVKKVAEYADILRASGLFRSGEPRRARLRLLPLYSMAVSAGTGQFLDSSDYETVEVGPEVPPSADYGVRVAGDSMEPRYHDGQTVWIHSQRTLESGETGVFLYDDNAFLKQLAANEKGAALHSLNPAYPDIAVGSFAELRVLGRAVT